MMMFILTVCVGFCVQDLWARWYERDLLPGDRLSSALGQGVLPFVAIALFFVYMFHLLIVDPMNKHIGGVDRTLKDVKMIVAVNHQTTSSSTSTTTEGGAAATE